MPRDFATGYRRLLDSDRMTANPEVIHMPGKCASRKPTPHLTLNGIPEQPFVL